MVRIFGIYIFVYLMQLCLCHNQYKGKLTPSECKTLGYNSSVLKYSDCKRAEQSDASFLAAECKSCCQETEIESSKRYPKAILEVCACKFGLYPQIEAFVKSDKPSKFPSLQIKYLRGAEPVVKLLDKNDNVKEWLSINKWDTDTVEEFFHLRLENNEEPDYIATNLV